VSVPTDAQRAELLAELQRVEKIVRADLIAQYRADAGLMARARQRLADEENSPSDVEAWLQTFAGRGAVLYILKTLYVRVLEDQGLLPTARIRAGGSYELFQRLFPSLGVAAYLRRVFTDASRVLPELFLTTAVEITEPSEASARELWAVWQAAAPGGGPRFDFRGDLDTRFIGDLYQDLDPDVKKRFALLQTPVFIEEFILDRTLDPALEKFGLDEFRIIDPTCGSGHFLLGAFRRLAREWRARLGDSAEARWDAAVRALAAVFGADLNEYACAMSRFRLLLAVVRESGVNDPERLRGLHFNVITCDSLIPWERVEDRPLPGLASYSWLSDYGSDEERIRNEQFFERGFHAVVGNPPYISVADKKKREDYRLAWPRSASGKYSLSAPMTERFMLMPVSGGCTGIIVGNNFCKRSFGRGLVERVLPDVQLDLVVDSSGTYIPGHGTPTVMLFSSRTEVAGAKHAVQVVVGKHGEPKEPVDPARGIVWSAIAEHWSQAGYEDRWIAVQEAPQSIFCAHPWSLGSDIVLRLKAILDAFPRVKEHGAEAGPAVIIIEDDAFLRRYARALPLRSVVIGADVRDWRVAATACTAVVPHDDKQRGSSAGYRHQATRDLWELRTSLRHRGTFGSTFQELGLDWWSFRQYIPTRLGAGNQRIVFSETATNSHFVVDAGDSIFIHSAPVLVLRGADDDLYRDIAAVLNSSTIEFWLKQMCFDKGNGGINGGIAAEEWEKFYVRNATNVVEVPIPSTGTSSRLAMVQQMDANLARLRNLDPAEVIDSAIASFVAPDLVRARADFEEALEGLVALQEELDWLTYRDFDLLDDPPLVELEALEPLALGHRPFEIVLARRSASGEEFTSWFERHGLTPTTDLPDRYKGAMRSALERRIALIESDETAALLEQPTYKRRWHVDLWEARVKLAAESWLLDRLEAELKATPVMLSVDELVDRLGADPKIIAVVALAKLENEVSLADSLGRLLAHESIPDNPARLFTAAALNKYLGSQTAHVGATGSVPDAEPFRPGEYVDWKRVWRLQEREDAGEKVTVAVPPAFGRADYAHPNGWKIRGKFNVPNERFIAYDELRPIRYAWGGWTAADRAQLSLRAFELRGREPDGAPEKPNEESPQRCGIQFALWDKIDELRRTGDSAHEEVQTIAQLCGRACPCDVLPKWRSLSGGRSNGRARKTADVSAQDQGVLPGQPNAIDSVLVERVLVLLKASGGTGLPLPHLEVLFSGDRRAAQSTLEVLRGDGLIEAVGKGRGLRYRLPQARLL
jgi:hypothetical protein